MRDDRHAEGAANAVVNKFVPSKGVDAGRARHRKTNDSKSSRAAMHGWRSSGGRGRKMTERERERGE